MSTIKKTAEQFFDACETGKGWEACRKYCHADASFSAQADALASVGTLEAYTDWMKGLLSLAPDGRYELRSFAVDEDRSNVTAYAGRGRHRRPPATGSRHCGASGPSRIAAARSSGSGRRQRPLRRGFFFALGPLPRAWSTAGVKVSAPGVTTGGESSPCSSGSTIRAEAAPGTSTTG